VKAQEGHIESIITRKINGEITAEEQVVLNQWVADSKENARYLKDLQSIYFQANKKHIDKTEPIDVDQEWRKFKNTIQTQSRTGLFNSTLLRIAASVVLVATLGYFLWFSQFRTNTIEVIAQTWGEEVRLPDNSLITLNKGAVLTYPKTFSGSNRAISLTGEAFFEITRNENKPFLVNLSQSTVKVLGTSFNINANGNDNKIEVVVNTGKVMFTNSALDESIILTKGEKGTLIKNTNMLTQTFNNDINVLAWKTRKLIFNNTELDKVIKTINRLYEAQVSFSTDTDKNCNVTVSFENQSLEAVLSVLKLTLDLEYKKSGDVIEIIKTGC